MPLGPFEREILALVAGNRSPASFVAGATVLHCQPDSPRISRDIDVRYSPVEVAEVQLSRPADLGQMKRDLLQATAEAEKLFSRLPMPEMGCLYLDNAERPVLPDPGAPGFSALTRHFGSVGGSRPTAPRRYPSPSTSLTSDL